MRNILLLIFFCSCLTNAKSQSTFDFKKLNKNQANAVEDETEINRLKDILIKKFLQNANDSLTKTYQQIQLFFDDCRIDERDTIYIYPKVLNESNLSIIISDFEKHWSLQPIDNEYSKLEGYRDNGLNTIISIPIYDTFNRGYAIHSIIFYCSLSEVIHWIERRKDQNSIEQLPSYSKKYYLKIKKIDFNE